MAKHMMLCISMLNLLMLKEYYDLFIYLKSILQKKLTKLLLSKNPQNFENSQKNHWTIALFEKVHKTVGLFQKGQKMGGGGILYISEKYFCHFLFNSDSTYTQENIKVLRFIFVVCGSFEKV